MCFVTQQLLSSAWKSRMTGFYRFFFNAVWPLIHRSPNQIENRTFGKTLQGRRYSETLLSVFTSGWAVSDSQYNMFDWWLWHWRVCEIMTPDTEAEAVCFLKFKLFFLRWTFGPLTAHKDKKLIVRLPSMIKPYGGLWVCLCLCLLPKYGMQETMLWLLMKSLRRL